MGKSEGKIGNLEERAVQNAVRLPRIFGFRQAGEGGAVGMPVRSLEAALRLGGHFPNFAVRKKARKSVITA